MEYTERGFARISFTDSNQEKCSVQESSRADAEELEYLREFYQYADFGPANGEVINDEIRREGGTIPAGYDGEAGL